MESKKSSHERLLSSTMSATESNESLDFLLSAKFKKSIQLSRRRRLIHSPILHATWVLCTLLGLLVYLSMTRKPTDQQCTKKLNLYSPMLEAVEYVEKDFSNEFNSTSIYRGPPTPEREAAWDKLTYKPEHAIEVPVNEIKGLNRTESDRLKHVPEDVGTGYVGIIEVFHQLHCLNMIRQYTWFQVGKYPGPPPPTLQMSPLKNRMHVDHCIESLRLALQCWGDVTPVLIKNGGPAGRKADFNSHHKCRNFDKLENWIDNNWTVP